MPPKSSIASCGVKPKVKLPPNRVLVSAVPFAPSTRKPDARKVLAVKAEAQVPGRAHLGGRHVVEADRARQRSAGRVGIAFARPAAPGGTGDAATSRLAAALPDARPRRRASGWPPGATAARRGRRRRGRRRRRRAGGRGGPGGAARRRRRRGRPAIAGGGGSSSGAVWPKAVAASARKPAASALALTRGRKEAAHGPTLPGPGRPVKCRVPRRRAVQRRGDAPPLALGGRAWEIVRPWMPPKRRPPWTS